MIYGAILRMNRKLKSDEISRVIYVIGNLEQGKNKYNKYIYIGVALITRVAL